MSTRLSSVFPRPAATDPDDVVWTLQTAAVQWQRGLRADAIVWVRKAADTATQLGHVARAEELRNHAARLAEFLWTDPEESLEGSPAPRTGTSRRVLERDDDADEIIEVEEIDAFDDDFSETDLPTPDDAAAELTAEDLAQYGVGAAPGGNALPDDLDLRSDSERPLGDRDSFMSVSPEPEDGEDSETGRDSFMSVSPEPDEEESADDYLDVSPESASPRPAMPSAHIFERPTEPRIPKQPLVARVPRYAMDTGDSQLRAERAAPLSEPAPPPRAAPPLQPVFNRSPYDSSAGNSGSPLFDPKSLMEPSLAPAATAPPPAPTAPPPAAVADTDTPAEVDGLALESVETLGDLPEEAQAELAGSGQLVALELNEQLLLEEGIALITRGSAHVTLPRSDVSAGRAAQGAVIAARGSIESGPLRLIAGSPQTHVVKWREAAVTHATRDCPWVVDDLRVLADRYQAHAAAGLGPLGARLDDALRAAVYERLEVRMLAPNEQIAERGKPLKGLFIVAVGELRVASGETGRRIGAGEFVFPGSVIGAEPAPHDVKAGPQGGLVLFATRPVAHELMMSVPPLLEILAS